LVPTNSLVDLLADLLLDSERWSCAPVKRDVLTLRRRVEHESESFITLTLPKFCKDFERSLAEGRVAPGYFLSFRKEKSGIPSFLRGFLRRVFDKDGVLLDAPSIDCIRAVRQICLFGKKVQRPCSDARNAGAIERYAQCDAEIVDPPDCQVMRYFGVVADIVVSTAFHSSDILSDITPTHGPGATRERISGNQKWRFRRWHRRLSRAGITHMRFVHGSSMGLLPCQYHERSEDDFPDFVEPEDEEPVRVITVPKTQKSPRIIAVEPVCMQYAQQGLSRWIVARLESCVFTMGHVNFRDQSVNQSLAVSASTDGKLATMDMSEASDRVSLALVQRLLASQPELLTLVESCRSTRAELPDGEVIHLKKFASMGSALCFPMEALVFYSLIIASRIAAAGRFPTRQSVLEFAQSVYVYGDDLIVPVDEAQAICSDLEAFGLKVNVDKTFWTGKFRESCGADAYDGELVTPVYLRRDMPADRTDVSGVLSCVATANQLFQAGFESASTSIRKDVERVVGKLPAIPHSSPDPQDQLKKGLSSSSSRGLRRWLFPRWDQWW